jgi:hypothetical protein
VLGLSF